MEGEVTGDGSEHVTGNYGLWQHCTLQYFIMASWARSHHGEDPVRTGGVPRCQLDSVKLNGDRFRFFSCLRFRRDAGSQAQYIL